MSAFAVVAVEWDRCIVLGAYGPFDEDEAGAICAAAISKGATPGELQVVELAGVRGGSLSAGWSW